MRDHGQELVSLQASPVDAPLTGSRLKVLKDEIKKPYFLNLKRFLYETGVRGPNSVPMKPEIYPAREILVYKLARDNSQYLPHTAKNIYMWSNLTPLGRVKVVIIGQDPYHNPGQAHGECLAVLAATITNFGARPVLLGTSRHPDSSFPSECA